RHHKLHGNQPSARTAVPIEAVARIATVLNVEFLALGGVGCACHSSREHQKCHQSIHPKTPQRGCVTTSINAGSPFFTRSMPRFNAGARSFGSLIGPSPYIPYACAIFA